MRKILIAAGAMICLAGAALASASEPIIDHVPMIEVSSDFDVLALLPGVPVDVAVMAEDNPAPLVAMVSQFDADLPASFLVLSALADVMPDFALSGGDGHLT